jgi:hypothetical protein
MPSSSQKASSFRAKQDAYSPYRPAATAPQTPAPPQNPFGGASKGVGSLLGGTQLFAQSQYSSAFKKVSPTWSRPSPNVFAQNSISPNIGESSPLKMRANVSSPTVCQPSSPRVCPSSSVKEDTDVPTPLNPTKKPSPIPEEPPFQPIRLATGPNPLEHYEPMKVSQERKASVILAEHESSSDDSDSLTDAFYRQRRIQRKKDLAAKDLSAITFHRSSKQEESTCTETLRAQPDRNTPQSSDITAKIQPSNPSEPGLAQATIADSQGQRSEATPRPSMAKATLPDCTSTSSKDRSINDTVPDSTAPERSRHALNITQSNHSLDEAGTMSHQDRIPETSPPDAQSRFLLDMRPANAIHESKRLFENKKPDHPDLPITNSCGEVSEGIETSFLRKSTRSVTNTYSQRRSTRARKPTAKSLSADTPNSPSNTALTDRSDMSLTPTDQIAPVEEPTDENGVSNLPDSSSPAVFTRARKRRAIESTRVNSSSITEQPDTSGSRTESAYPIPPTTSPLTELTQTPTSSHNTTPATQDSSVLSNRTDGKMLAQSPTGTEGRRRGASALPLPSLVTSTAATRRSLRATGRPGRQLRIDSASTDELLRSPSDSTVENSAVFPKGGRFTRSMPLPEAESIRATQRNISKLFQGMAFALSFQSRKPSESTERYDKRLGVGKDIGKAITNAGGLLLSIGFDELFNSSSFHQAVSRTSGEESCPVPLELTEAAQNVGFTALIADGHSRKAKYMQALAFDLPCISDRWVTTCLEKCKIVDWSPYLLCAGQSAFLRDAIRSRHLNPYPAINAKLAVIVQNRPQFLIGNKILLVMQKSRTEDRKMPYLFLIHVLGASLSRVCSIEDARQTLLLHEQSDTTFDWIYLDEQTGTEEALFAVSVQKSVPIGTKKRKRSNLTTQSFVDKAVTPRRIRILTDELVIQSLILGRIIEEDEL